MELYSVTILTYSHGLLVQELLSQLKSNFGGKYKNISRYDRASTLYCSVE